MRCGESKYLRVDLIVAVGMAISLPDSNDYVLQILYPTEIDTMCTKGLTAIPLRYTEYRVVMG